MAGELAFLVGGFAVVDGLAAEDTLALLVAIATHRARVGWGLQALDAGAFGAAESASGIRAICIDLALAVAGVAGGSDIGCRSVTIRRRDLLAVGLASKDRCEGSGADCQAHPEAHGITLPKRRTRDRPKGAAARAGR